MRGSSLPLKLIIIFLLIAGLPLISVVIREIRELSTNVLTLLRLLDLSFRSLIIVISPIVAFGLWKVRRWGFSLSFILIALHIGLRSLGFFDAHYTVENKIVNTIAIIIFLMTGAYLYWKSKSFEKPVKESWEMQESQLPQEGNLAMLIHLSALVLGILGPFIFGKIIQAKINRFPSLRNHQVAALSFQYVILLVSVFLFFMFFLVVIFTSTVIFDRVADVFRSVVVITYLVFYFAWFILTLRAALKARKGETSLYPRVPGMRSGEIFADSIIKL